MCSWLSLHLCFKKADHGVIVMDPTCSYFGLSSLLFSLPCLLGTKVHDYLQLHVDILTSGVVNSVSDSVYHRHECVLYMWQFRRLYSCLVARPVSQFINLSIVIRSMVF